MPKSACPNCGFEPHPDEGPNCTRCNTPLVTIGGDHDNPINHDQSSSIDSYTGDREQVSQVPLKGEEQLGSQSTAQLVEQQGLEKSNYDTPHIRPPDSTPVMPETRDIQPRIQPEQANESAVKKLSEKEIQQIEKDLYGGDKYVSDDEKLAVLRNMPGARTESSATAKALHNSPADDTILQKRHLTEANVGSRKKTLHMANHVVGVAFFVNRFIQIAGEQELHDGDSLFLKEREYILKKKRLSSNLILGIAGSIGAILLLTLVLKLSPGSNESSGIVVGITVDQSGQPIQKRLLVRFPDLEEETTTELNGFFKISDIPAGSHTIEFLDNDQILGQDFAAVAKGEITTIILRPTAKTPPSPQRITKAKLTTTASTKPKGKSSNSSQPVISTKQKAQPKVADKSTQKATATRKASLILASNVEGARLKLDGKVLGAGNLSYKNLTAGTHRYQVSFSGYKTSSGEIKLKAGESTRLNVTLTPMQTKQQTAALEAQRLIASGTSALDAGQYEKAVTELNSAIKLEPSNPSAHLLRAKANSQIRNIPHAYDDYIRAAEIFQFQNKLSKANTAYRHAIETDDKIIGAYLGRGNLYLAQNQEIAAVADFETALRIDKRNAAVYIGLGESRYRRGNYKKAIKHFKDARSLESDNPTAHQGLMRSYFKRDKIKDLRKAYERFVKNVSAADVSRFRANPKYAPILRLVDSGK